MNNQLTQTEQKSRFSVAIQSINYKNLVSNTLTDPDRARRFVAAITSAVAVSPALQKCTPGSILTCGFLGEALNLSPSPQLGHYYLVPFDCKKKDTSGNVIYVKDEKGDILKDKYGKSVAKTETHAQFILGYKGYIQLAIRSGQYRNINVIEVKEGEFKNYDYLAEELTCMPINDWEAREAAPTVGYYAMFELMNGFRKTMYWTKSRMEVHADKYSKAFSLKSFRQIQRNEIPEKDMWKYSSHWYEDFDDMAKKTMLRQLISKWGIMSIEMQRAFDNDESLSDDKGNLTPLDDVQDAPIIDKTKLAPDQLKPEATDAVEKIDLRNV